MEALPDEPQESSLGSSELESPAQEPLCGAGCELGGAEVEPGETVPGVPVAAFTFCVAASTAARSVRTAAMAAS